MTTRDEKMFFVMSSGGGVRLDPILRFLHNLIDLVKMRQATAALHAIEKRLLRGQRRVDGVETPRHRADAATETTSRRWRDDAQSGTVVCGGGNLRRPISSGPRQKRRLALGDPTYFFIGRSFVGDKWGLTSMLSADTVVMIVGVVPVPGTGSSVMCGFL